MAYPLYVAFIWHQHQPLYKSPEAIADPTGQYRMPWVRLHGVKDYLDLVLVLEEYPQLHQTVNLVPSLILQLEEYVHGTARDPYMALTLTPENSLTNRQKSEIIEHFFDANHHTLIDPHPRYRQLYEQRQDQGIKWCLENWRSQDYADLLAWHNLAWIDPLFRERDPQIQSWLEKGRGFTLSDRQQIIKKQIEIISEIVPQHRKMQQSGQLEVTTTPYTHPILPLLADSHAGRVAIPEMSLPERPFKWTQDIPRHLQKAKQIYIDHFRRQPRGLWPSEQSVSPAILPHIAQAKFKWICSDEAVLGWSLGHFFHRDETGNLYQPELLYRPYRLETLYGDLAIVFRDHRLSDLIGFTYGGMDSRHAVSDFIGHLEAIARSLMENQGSHETRLNHPWLVTIALDGENCWEHYHQDGLPFLRELYSRLSHDHDIQLVTVSEFLQKFPPTQTIQAEKLHSGSWIDGSFSTWIGDPVKNKAWDLLVAARQMMAKHPEATPTTNPDAWEALYAAEGSDWFWWFGEGHSSNHDALFDQLFREHLRAVYHALNETVPSQLYEPLEDHALISDRTPESFIQPVIDGYGDEQDWSKAGRIEIGGARGTMHKASVVQRLFYGLNH
ncbi:MAG TPA: glycoside hydrolase, partial [Cyanothece sp. UBA12306]|nr:glycoside hydrolase [Cyanothece sp. UBA12306]